LFSFLKEKVLLLPSHWPTVSERSRGGNLPCQKQETVLLGVMLLQSYRFRELFSFLHSNFEAVIICGDSFFPSDKRDQEGCV